MPLPRMDIAGKSLAEIRVSKSFIDLKARLNAHKNLHRLGFEHSYPFIAKLIGSPKNDHLNNLTDSEIFTLRLLAGPHAHAIYRMLLIKHDIKEENK